ncbi:hypothetical protein DJ71_22440 [Halorubrum sp. E3]|nr:hypothetical protein DJ71_22440 [Halorubrum sp. E3]
MDLPVDADRLRADLAATAAFGRVTYEAPEKLGRTNLTGSAANRAARDRLVERFEDAGLEVAVDAVGNLVGTWVPDSADPDAAPVASGSHLDSVPEGGIFDGPLGVYAALEAVRAMRDAGVEPARPVAVVSFTEEEGATFGSGLLGSSVATGATDADEALLREVAAAVDDVEVVDTGYAYHVKSTGVSKGRALGVVADALDIDPAAFVAVGDSENDVSTFEVAGESYAVANADDAAREAADEVVGEGFMDGTVSVLERLRERAE